MLTRFMALRVLLADESTTIKKVFQLALQDYAVEVTAVNVGIDVEQVAEKIKPDIVFADVLLQKKNGYDVCSGLKSSPQLANIPVVLIWSGFMELDQHKYKSCGANANLEKPFDAARLRQVVQSLVGKTKTQALSEFLSFPKLPDFEEVTPSIKQITKPVHTESWSMDSFENIEHTQLPPIPDENTHDEDAQDDFVAIELPTEPPRPPTLNKPALMQDDSSDNDAQWVQKTLSNYRLDPSKTKDEEPKLKYKIPNDQDDVELVVTNSRRISNLKQPETKQIENDDIFELDLADTETTQTAPLPQPIPTNLSEKQLESIIRAQSTEVIEKVVWQVVPEIATRIIERELNRLLKERNER